MNMYQLEQIPSEAQIRRFIRRTVFGKNVFCPVCRSQKVVRYETRFRCRRCRYKFSLISHTWLKDMKISLQKFWMLLWCWTAQVPIKQTMRLTRLSESAARHWFDLFRSHLPHNPCILEKVVQLDETFFKKKAVMLAKQAGTRKLAFEVLHTTAPSKWHACYFLQQHVRPGSRLQTDGSGIYKAIDRWWPVTHRTDIHKKWEFALTSEIEGMFGNFRTFVRRMYHHVTPDKLPELVREFCVRFSLPEMFEDPHTYLQKTLTLVPID
jgi:transposase-like protein